MSSLYRLREDLVLFLIYALIWAVVPVYGLFSSYILYSRGFSLFEVGAFGSAYNAISMVGQYVFGHLSDSLRSRRKFLQLAELWILIVSVSLSAIPSITAYVVAALASGFMAGGFSTVILASSSEISRGGMGRNVSFVRIGGAVGWIAGSLTIPTLLTLYGFRTLFLILSLEAASALLVSLTLLGETYSEHGSRRSRREASFLLYAYAFTSGICVSAASWLLPAYVYSTSGTLIYLGEVIATGAAAEVPSMFAAGRIFDSPGKVRNYLIALNGAILGSAFLLYALIPLNSLPLAQAIRGVGYAFFIVTTPALLVSRSTSRGRSSGIFFSSFSAGSLAGGIVGGTLSSLLGLRPFFLLISGLILVSSVLVNYLARREPI